MPSSFSPLATQEGRFLVPRAKYSNVPTQAYQDDGTKSDDDDMASNSQLWLILPGMVVPSSRRGHLLNIYYICDIRELKVE